MFKDTDKSLSTFWLKQLNSLYVNGHNSYSTIDNQLAFILCDTITIRTWIGIRNVKDGLVFDLWSDDDNKSSN